MNTYLKFGVLIVVIVGSLVWLALGGIRDTKTYYKTIPELAQMGKAAQTQRLRVGGDVKPGSILKRGAQVSFVLHQGAQELKRRLHGHRSSARHVQGQRTGARRRPSRSGRRIRSHQNSGEMCFEVRGKASSARAIPPESCAVKN